MEQIHIDRLNTLANYLDKVKPERFNISQFTKGKTSRLSLENACGSTACALGYCPLVFPGLWEWDAFGIPFLAAVGNYDPFYASQRFFGITDEETDLFLPQGWGEVPAELRRTITPQMVAAKIRSLLSEKVKDA